MKTIVTHTSPDLDAISSVWLIKRFLPNWHNAQVEFVPAGLTLDKEPPDENPLVIHVDTGLGSFDHHQNNENTCSAKKVFLFLKRKDFINKKLINPLERMVNIFNEIDHFREVFLPKPDNDIYDFLIIGILDGLRMKFQNDSQMIETGELILDGILRTFINKIKAEKEIQTGSIFKTKWGKAIGLETDNEEASRLAQKKGYSLVVRKSPKQGHIRIKLSPYLSRPPTRPSGLRSHFGERSNLKKDLLNLFVLHKLLKQKDPKATWYFHSSGQMILNGTTKNPDTIPTKLSLNEVVDIVKKLK